MELMIENVRCLAGRHQFAVRPITILTGENSSGKSTFLACLAAVCDPVGFPSQPGLNKPPFALGSFENIATYKGGRAGRAKSFSLGLIQDRQGSQGQSEMCATYVSGELGQTELSLFRFLSPAGEAQLITEGTGQSRTVTMTIKVSGRKPHTATVSADKAVRDFKALGVPNFMTYFLMFADAPGRSSSVVRDTFEVLHEAVTPHALSIAPIRTKPERTYDRATEDFTPEGDHIPFVLLRHLTKRPPTDEGEALRRALERFGANSGLYHAVGVKPLGHNASDPFQVRVSGGGPPANLLDVGYGVSQALPVIVQAILASHRRLLLLQQPEVHLHPRAQAALGTFFIDMYNEGHKSFVIETHSDYIVDRIRQSIAAGKVDPTAVGILYFEKRGIETKVHQLDLDRQGNIVGAPPSYREFFLREEMNLLNRSR